MSCPPGAPGPYLRFQPKAMNWPLGDQEGDAGVAAVGEALHAGAVGVHDVELREAGASADPCDLRAGAGIEAGRDVRAAEVGDAAGALRRWRRRCRCRGRRWETAE